MKGAPRTGTPRSTDQPLRRRQARFAVEYTVDLNATQAAKRAGYAPSAANSIGSSLLKSPEVQAAIAARTADRFARLAIDRERVLHEIARAAFADLARLYRDDGTLRNISEIDDDTLAAVSSLDVESTDRRRLLRVRRLDKLAALELLGQHRGLFGERVEVTAGAPRAAEELDRLMAAGRKRAP